ncbi:MAG: DUF6691 family protein [Alphaproteobacteria bacterium]
MRPFIAALAGALFGLGLVVSGMANPMIVLGFFDVAGAWNPQLAVVMAAALAVMAPAWWVAGRLRQPLVGGALPGPPSPVIDARLIGGSALFGLGWGITGLCPAPALAAAGLAGSEFWAFIIAMSAGVMAPSLVAGGRTAASWKP